MSNPVPRPVASSSFVVAPTIALGYSPTTVASGHLTLSGKLDLVTADSVTGQISVFVGMGRGKFSAAGNYAAGTHPTAVAIGDLDGDGAADVVVVSEADGVVSVFPGNGDGTLGQRKTFAVGFNPALVALGDFTGNGKLDVAVASKSGTTLAILQNDGAGNLKKPLIFGLNGVPVALAVGDFNHDGHSDLAIANANGTVSILLGKGNGQLSAATDISVGQGALSTIAVGDFNRDGNDDLVVTSAGQNQVSVLLGQGNGKFGSPAGYAVGNSPVSTQVADVDGDGIPDLIVVNKGSNTFSVLSGAGDGTFKPALHFVVGNSPLGAAAGDFYGTGHIDVATIDQLSRTMSLPAGNGDSTFAASRAYAAGAQPVAVASGDLRGIGTSDLVVANYCAADATCGGSGSAAVLLGGTNGVYRLSAMYPMGTGSISIALLDVNGDRKLDLVALNRVDKTLSVRLGAGDGSFGNLTTIPLSIAPLALASADFNGDGFADLAVLGDCGSSSCSQAGQVSILLGTADGSFHSGSTYTVGYSPAGLAVGATRVGGKADLVIANRCGKDASCKSGGTATVLLGDGAGAFTAGTDIALGNSPVSLALASLRGTGVLDLVVSRTGDNAIAVLPGTGAGTFGTAVPYAVGTAPGALVVGDFNGDGKPDVAVANTGDATVSVLFSRSDGSLQSGAVLPVGGTPAGLAAIAGVAGAPASLATANGSAGSPASGANLTVVPNLRAHANGITANTTSFTAGPYTTALNSSLSLTVNVVGGSGTPTGSVTVTSDGTPAAVCTISLSQVIVGTAGGSCSVSNLQTNVTTLTAAYPGDGTYTNSQGTASVTVTALTPTVGVTALPVSPSTANTSVTFTATLAGVTFAPVAPGGSAAFFASGTPIAGCATQPVNASQQAFCPTAFSTAGSPYSITATYGGDANFNTATSPGLPFTVNKASPTITVTPSTPSPVTVNTSVTFTAALTGVTLTPNGPGGTMSFTLDGSPAVCDLVTQPINVNSTTGQASCTISNMVVGAPNSVVATYTGDSNFAGGTGTGANFTVNKATPTVSFATTPPSPASPQALNTAVTFTATLTGVPLTPITPGGTMTFKLNGSNATCAGGNPASVSSAGVAACQIQNMPAGTTNLVSATYSGDGSFSTNTGTAANYTITALAPTISFAPAASPASPSALNTAVTFTAQLGGVALTPVTPTGKFTFLLNGSAATCNGSPSNAITVSAGGAAACIIQNMPAGSNAVTATYGSDTNFVTASTGSAPAYTITPLTGTLGLTPAPGATVAVGTATTFTAKITASSVSPIAPSGTVTFLINGSANSDCPNQTVNASQQATCTTRSLVVPIDSIAASYSGDTNFTVTGATTINETVTKSTPAATLAASTLTPVVDQPITFTATVSAAAGQITTPFPTGSVTFTQGATVLCLSAQVLSTPTLPLSLANQPKATCTSALGAVGTLPVVATYSGDSNYNIATSNTVSEVVTAAGTTTNISALPTTASISQTVTVSTTITPILPANSTEAFPKGTVMFATDAGAPPSGTCASVTGVAVGSNGIVPNCTFSFAGAGTIHITATYTSSDANFTGGTSNTTVVTVSTGTFSLILNSGTSPSTNPSLVNQPANFTAAFNPPGLSPSPTGTVSYFDGTSAITGCTALAISAGVIPTCTTTFISAGSHQIQAKFTTGDANYTSTNSNQVAQIVNPEALVTAVSGPGSTTVNTQVQFTANLSATPTFVGAGLVAPTGTVTFNKTLNGQTTFLCPTPSTLTNGGTTAVSCMVSFPAIGSYTISAIYNQNGDNNFVQGTSTPWPVSVGTTGTSVGVTPASATFSVNQSSGVTFTATVSPTTTGSSTPTGTMTFTDSVAGTQLCAVQNVTANGSGGATASCPVVFLKAGTHTLTATYGGDSNFAGGTAGTSAVTVNATSTTTTLSPAVTSPVNTPVTFTATITPAFTGTALPTGTVTFTNTSAAPPVTLCTQTIAADGTVPACVYTFSSAGQFTVKASYSGDSNFGASSTTVSQTISAGSTAIALASSLIQSSVNQPITLTAAFTPIITGTQPTGTVVYQDGAATICTVTLAAGLIPNCPYSFPTAGPHTVSASFAGDANFGKANSNTVSQTVLQANTTASVSSSSAPGASTATSFPNQTITFTATITPAFTIALNVPTGSVTFFSNNVAIPGCSNVALAAGTGGTSTAPCQDTFLATGTYSITVSYTGDTNFISAASTAVAQKVVPPTSSMTVTPAQVTSTVNQAVNFSVVITPPNPAPGGTTPTGTVTFTDAADAQTLLCTSAPVIGAANGTSTSSCSITFLNVGPHTIVATYNGDTNFKSNFASAGAVTVGPSATVVSVTSSKPASFATQSVTFTAVVSPSPNVGPSDQVPPGVVMFTSSDTTGLVAAACPNPVPVAPIGGGKSAASCTVTFAHSSTPVGQLSVLAAYSDTADGNFTSSSSSTPQTVQDFNVAYQVTPPSGSVSSNTGVFLTQAYSTTSDLFGAATISNMIATSTGYNPSLTVACEVFTTNPAAPLPDPSCTPTLPQTVAVASGAGAQAFVINASVSAPIGAYTVLFTTFDPNFPSVTHTASFPLYVVGTNASISLATGASSNQALTFNTSAAGGAGDTISTTGYSCPRIWNGTALLDNSKGAYLTCSGPAVTVTGASTSIQISISAAASTTALNVRTSNTIYAATFFTVPFLALLGWWGTRRSSRRNLFRFLGMVVLLIGLSFATGCGESVTRASIPVTTGLSPGSYLVQVVATGSSGNSYFAEVPINVIANH